MKNLQKKLLYALGIVMMLTVISSAFPFTAEAQEEIITLTGELYEFGENSKYEIDSSDPSENYLMDYRLGILSLKGDVQKSYSKNGIPAYEIADDETFSLEYEYISSLKDAGEDDWHLIKDGKNVVNGSKLDDDIDHGALIFQTSFDGDNWIDCKSYVNIKSDKEFDDGQINNIQLINGCYYRIIVAYEIEKRTKDYSWEIKELLKKDKYDIKKIAQVYTFYAGYKGADKNIPENIETFELGKTQAVKVDNGFTDSINMDSDDPHLGWDLGRFVVGGFTSNKKTVTGDTVFLKNVGDKITLWFDMNKNVNINKLNGDKHLTINSDLNGYDSILNVPQQNFKRGTLIIRFTDYKGITHDPIIYTNFLEALVLPGANTKVQLFEEGDYEVSLDYEILDDNWKDRFYDYKIAFNFQVRNSNAIVYPKDKVTNTYLANDSVTENGFILDWAKSRYLNINVQLSQWTKGVNGYTEDTKFNRSAKESDEYITPGIYTIKVTNPTTDPYGQNPTVKKIYVGSDSVIIASMNAKNSAYTINEISDLVENAGYEISDSGELIPPESSKTEVTSSIVETSYSIRDDTIEPETSSVAEKTVDSMSASETDQTTAQTDRSNVYFIWIGILSAVGIIAVIIRKYKGNK
ncbi:hypothetical protein [Ruminococcus albus]|uniref:Uncharacterized protein n=1 Tax=Ruminococcus albus (strain ATCC 27210 / DSM 20455 / JCM 14654 / NCDO 2250 / 7) TaxID=697329 RepID=E6UJN2_RUMA7|nr:hypothetical protein [Ruminococcus albus]ADU23878.1 hypothetical protein Rumal_3425 [Ruminococcus albus 7 = DSM 20455]